jgi:transposase-like protein
MRRKYTSEQRTQLIDLVAKGTTVVEAAKSLGVGESTAYNWAAESRKSREPTTAPQKAPTFVRLMPSAAVNASIVVRVGGAEVDVRRGFDGDLLRAVVATLSEGPR